MITAGALAACLAPAQAEPVQLTFEHLTVPIDGIRQPVYVDQYYNGGQVTASVDSLNKLIKAGDAIGDAGPDFNVVVSGSSTWALESSGTGTGAFSSSGLNLGTGALGLFESGSALVQMVDGSSFNGALSFYFAAAGGAVLTVRVAGGGSDPITEAFTFSGEQTCADPNGFCKWQMASFNLGALAGITSVTFGGVGVLIDNITLGSLDPSTRTPPGNGIPEPATYALMAFGLAAVALTARRRSRQG